MLGHRHFGSAFGHDIGLSRRPERDISHMASLIQKNFRARKTFAKLKQVIEIPNLIDIQKRSYDKFLQIDIPIDKREDIGLQGVFKSVFPIKDFSETSSLEFVSYNLEKPKYDVDECRARGMTFAAPIKVVIRLVVWDVNEETGVQSIRDVKEQEVYFGEIPLMTDSGTFIINGTERVIVSAAAPLARRVLRPRQGQDALARGKLLYIARVIPYRGSWLDFEFDHKDILYVRIDRRRKLHATVLLRALGYSTEELLNYFYDTETIHFEPQQEVQPPGQLRAARRPARDARHQAPEDQGSPGQEEPQVHQGRDPQAAGVGRRPAADRPRRARRQGLGEGRDRRVDRRGAPPVQRGADRGRSSTSCAIAASRRSRCCSSTTSTSVRTSATRCSPTSSRAPTRRSWRSIAACARAISRRSIRRRRCSTTCSSTPSATTCRASAA